MDVGSVRCAVFVLRHSFAGENGLYDAAVRRRYRVAVRERGERRIRLVHRDELDARGGGFSAYFINQYGGDKIIDARVKARVALRVDSHQLSAQRGGPAENRASFHARAPVDYDFRRHVESAVDFASVQERGGLAPFHRDYVRLYAGQSAHLFYLVPQPREFAAQHFLLEQEARFADVVRNRG